MIRTIILLSIIISACGCQSNNDRMKEYAEQIAELAAHPMVYSTVDSVLNVNQRLELLEYSDSTYYFTIKSGTEPNQFVETGFIEIVETEERIEFSNQLQNMEHLDLYKSWSKKIVYCVYLDSSERSYAIIDVCSELKPNFEVTNQKMGRE